MARLTSEQWEQARAEYEVRGVSLGEVASRFGVSQQAAAKRARKEGWKQGKSCGVVEKKVSAIKALYEVEQESCDLPTTFRATIDDVVRERLEADHLFAQFDKALILKAHAVLSKVELPEEWETMTRGRRNLAPQQERGTTVNVSQQASAQAAALAGASVLSPRDALNEILEQEQRRDDG